jgi:hypothetical protein
MSGTSWAGTSTRYHVHVPVGAILRPPAEEIQAIDQSTMSVRLIRPGGPGTAALRLSGTTPATRPNALRAMAVALTSPRESRPSVLAEELESIEDEGRRRLLILVGSYREARDLAQELDRTPEWHGRIATLISDDADLDPVWVPLRTPGALRRGDLERFPDRGQDLLIAPLLAVERGHNIVLDDGTAAIGSVLFLARPHPRPDDIGLAVQAVNDWAVRTVDARNGVLDRCARESDSLFAAATRLRAESRKVWNHLLSRPYAWSRLHEPGERESFAWDQLVVIWQVIGRLVRGGVPARAVFVDAAFVPVTAGIANTKDTRDTADTSLLAAMREQLRPYFEDTDLDPLEVSLVKNLYSPFYQALTQLPAIALGEES